MMIPTYPSSDLASAKNLGREAQEFMAIEGYRAGTLSCDQASQMLGLSRHAFDAFLKDRHIHDRACDVLVFDDRRETEKWFTAA